LLAPPAADSQGSSAGALRGKPLFCSWSGGKDSCLALYRAVRAGGQARWLLNMCTESGERSRSHGLAADVLRAQAAALGIPIVFRAASWDEYEKTFLDALAGLKGRGVTAGVFGDIDVEPHREWVERVCASAGMAACEPLWKSDRRELLDEFLGAGFEARLVALKDGALSPELLGRRLDGELTAEIESAGADACGENGEYHTVVVDGPLFSRPLELVAGERVLRDGYWFLDMNLVG